MSIGFGKRASVDETASEAQTELAVTGRPQRAGRFFPVCMEAIIPACQVSGLVELPRGKAGKAARAVRIQ